MLKAATFVLLLVLFAAPTFPQGGLLSEATDFVIFADFVIGAGWTFQLAITNNSPTTTLNGFAGVMVDPSNQRAVSFEEAFASGTVPLFTIPPGGTKIYSEWPNASIDDDTVIRGGVFYRTAHLVPCFRARHPDDERGTDLSQ